MGSLREWLTRLWSMLQPARGDDDLAEELRLHLELATEDEQRRADAGDAIRRAALRWGAVPSAMDAVRDQRGVPWLDDLLRDVRHELRSLRRNPTLATVLLLTLAIGIGANTTTFGVVNSVLLRPLSYASPDRLVAVWHTAPGAPGLADVSGDLRLSASMYFTYSEHNRTFEEIGLWVMASTTVTGMGEPEQVRALLVTDGALQALGVQPLRGRWLTDVDQQPGAPAAIMLGYGYWQRRFGGDASVIGQTITVDARLREIVGVMPRDFRMLDAIPDVIGPLALDRSRAILPGFGYQAVARLKPGVTLADASTDVGRMIPIWMSSWPAAAGVNPRVYEDWRITPALRPLKQDVVGSVGNVLWILMGTVGIVMLIVCANIANLLLVRTEGRHHELALRASLGAGRGRIVRGLLIESVTLGVLGGALGVAMAYGALRILLAIGPENLPRLSEIAIDARALAFTLAISLISSMLFGIIPVLRYAGPGMAEGLRANARTMTEGRRRHRARNLLVVTQVALALVLLISSGLMIRTFQSLRTVHPGFTNASEIQTVRISVPANLVPEPDRTAQIQRELVAKLLAIPGVNAASFASAMHIEGVHGNWDIIEPEGMSYATDSIPPLRVFKGVSPGFFATTGTRMLAGRDYTWTDLADGRPVVIVSENLARELWRSPAAALGKRIRTLNSAPWREVVGVVEDVRDNGVHEAAPAIVYWPSTTASYYRAGVTTVTRTVTFAIRSPRAGSESLMSEVRAAVWSVNASLPVAAVRTLQEMYEQSMARTSFTLVMLATAAGLALLLGLIGIYGVVAYAVSQRTREIAIRVAIGARPAELTRMFVQHAFGLTLIGVVIGLVVSAGLTQLMSSLLFGISPLDAATYAIVPPILLTTALVASYLPARRVATVDPMEALKLE